MNPSNTTNKAVSGMSNLYVELGNSEALSDSEVVLVREAGLPYKPPASSDPIEQ